MTLKKLFSKIILALLKKLFSLKENHNTNLGNVSSILIVRQHNQLGDMLLTFSFLRALKEKYPLAKISLLLSPQNYKAILGNKLVDSYFVFNKKYIYNPIYIISLIRYLRNDYDVCFVPVTVSISFTSNLLARISKSKIRVGANSLNGKINSGNFLFDRRIDLDWRQEPDSHYAVRILDLIRPFGIDTNNFQIEISYEKLHLKEADKFLSSFKKKSGVKIIGIHPGAGKPQNIWNLKKVVSLITKLKSELNTEVYLEGTDADKVAIEFVQKNFFNKLPEFRNKSIQETAALIEKSDLFITTDTATMHIAGSTTTPVISLFGETNPYNWAPFGKNKYFIRKSDLIDDIEVDDIFNLVKIILK